MRGSKVFITLVVLVVGICLLRPTIDRLLFAETEPRPAAISRNLKS
jgi:hypothetical protein